VGCRLLAVLALLFWGAWGCLSKLPAARGCPAGSLPSVRCSPACCPSPVYAPAAGTLRWHRRAPWSIVAGILGGIATALVYFALSRGPAAVVVPISGTYIVIPALLDFIFLREPMT